jgi:hypothetical protein
MLSPFKLKTGLIALVLCGAAGAWSPPAQAGESTGTWRNGMVDGPYGPGYYGPDGTYYGDGRRSRRRVYVPEYRRPSRNYEAYYEYDDPYARHRRHHWRDGNRNVYGGQDRDWEPGR